MSSDYHRPTHTFDVGAYNATQVRLYGIDPQSTTSSSGKALPDMTVSFQGKGGTKDKTSNASSITKLSYLTFDTQMMGFIVLAAADDGKEKPISVGVIYGYAYEGQCYDLPKPKIMLIRAEPSKIPKDDCGYDEKHPAGYRVWIVDKLDQCAEIELNQGFVEQIVLEANLPGKRSPRSYSAFMQLAHRSGRLSE